MADENTDATKAFYVNGCDTEIVFIDQYGEEISNSWCDSAMASFWTANDSGYYVDGPLVYFGICLFENGQKELIEAYGSIDGSDPCGVKFEVEEATEYEKASIGVVSYQGIISDDLNEIEAGYWSSVGDTAYVETVSRTVTYTFTPSSLGDSKTLTYYDETNAGTADLDSAGWYFSGTIKGTISMYVNGTFDSDIVTDDGESAMTTVLVTVLLTNANGEEVDVNDVPDNGATYTATFTLSGNTASYGGTEYNTPEWSIDLKATGTDSTNASIGEIFYDSGSGQTVSMV